MGCRNLSPLAMAMVLLVPTAVVARPQYLGCSFSLGATVPGMGEPKIVSDGGCAITVFDADGKQLSAPHTYTIGSKPLRVVSLPSLLSLLRFEKQQCNCNVR